MPIIVTLFLKLDIKSIKIRTKIYMYKCYIVKIRKFIKFMPFFLHKYSTAFTNVPRKFLITIMYKLQTSQFNLAALFT